MNDFDFRSMIERMREQTDIVEVIGSHISLNCSNKCLCPFHQEKTPSFSVNPKGQYFHCFGCGVGGDVFSSFTRTSLLWKFYRSLPSKLGFPSLASPLKIEAEFVMART